jgi:hypothetical protein
MLHVAVELIQKHPVVRILPQFHWHFTIAQLLHLQQMGQCRTDIPPIAWGRWSTAALGQMAFDKGSDTGRINGLAARPPAIVFRRLKVLLNHTRAVASFHETLNQVLQQTSQRVGPNAVPDMAPGENTFQHDAFLSAQRATKGIHDYAQSMVPSSSLQPHACGLSIDHPGVALRIIRGSA